MSVIDLKNREEKPSLEDNLIDNDLAGFLGGGRDTLHSEISNFELKQDEGFDYSVFNKIISQTPEMHYAINRACKLSRCNLPVLIYGQAGTGKSLFAKSIHEAGIRRQKPFVTVKAATILPGYMEKDFFGYSDRFSEGKNEISGFVEQADGGTLYIDEIDSIPAYIQVQLLRLIRSGEYKKSGENKLRKTNIRILAGTDQNLSEQVRLGNFRTDLYYAIAVGVVELPPLRQRKGDLIYLANHFLKQINQESYHHQEYVAKKLSAKARNLILTYSWPGNVRELYATLLRATLWVEGEKITYDDLKEALVLGIY